MIRKLHPLQDHGLWDEVTRTIKPLPRRAKPGTIPAVLASTAPGMKTSDGLHSARPVQRPASRSDTPPPLGGFDRRLAQRLSRGQLEPEARVDLHGEGVETARVQLYHFLEQRRREGVRLVLVITGKGASPYARHTLHGHSIFHSPEREGRLRREVPLWLHETVFRVHVIGFQPAHPRHGGGGALYVRLRQVGAHP